MEGNKEIAEALGYELVDDSAPTKETVKTEEPVKVEESIKQEEAPKSEKIEESTEQSDTTTDSSEATQEVKTESPSFEDLLLEKSGGKFKNYEDLEKTLTEKPQETESIEFANEQLEVLNRYVSEGGKLEDFLKTQVDYASMSEMDVIKAEMKLNDPDLSESDMDFLINKEYQLDTEEYDEDEVRLSKIKLRKDARKAKTSLKEWQDKYTIPEKTESVEPKKEVEQNNQPSQEAIAKEKQRWEKAVSESASKMEKIDFEINEKGDKFTFALSDEDRQNVVKSTSDLTQFWSKFMNGDGTENVEKLNKTMFMVDNFDKIIRAAASQFKSDGKDSVLKDIKNPNYSADTEVDSSGVGSLQEQMYAAWKKDN
tara:strand:- start:4197 stop:5303 length:1107 start_codon:yes stop_codon:yes gene_type:complete